MNRIAWIALVLLVTVGANSSWAQDPQPATQPALADQAAASAPAGPERLMGEYAIIASELKLPQDVRDRMAQKVHEKLQAIDAWNQQNAAHLKDLRDQQRAAETADNKTAADAARDQIRDLLDQKDKLNYDRNQEILSVLTPAQRQQWEGFSLFRSVTRHFAKADLTADQEAKVREMSNAAAKDLLAAPTSQPVLAREAAAHRLESDVDAQVLTAGQREKMNAPSPMKSRNKNK